MRGSRDSAAAVLLLLASGLAACTNASPLSRQLELYCTPPGPPPGDQASDTVRQAYEKADHSYLACERDRKLYDQSLMNPGGTFGGRR